MKKYYYTFNMVILNVLSFLLLFLFMGITFILINLFNINISISNDELIITMLLYVPYTIIHEILHSIGYVVNGASFKNITYGMHLEKGILCCSCKQEINKKNIMWSLMYPFIFIGIVTYILSLLFNNSILLLLSILNISGCIGDLIMFIDFINLKDFKYFEYDDPTSFGIVTKENMNNKKLFGLKQINPNNVNFSVNKKISISKISIIILIIYVLLMLVLKFI